MPGPDLMRVGLIGVGAIGSRLVEAIATGPRAGSVEFLLSPRSAQRSAALAQRQGIAVARSNQEVLDGSELVLLGVLPEQVADVCGALRFRADHVVAGLAAGWPASRLHPVVAPAARVTQLIPLPMVALHTGPIVASPALPEVRWLLEGCGEVVDARQEDDAVALLCATGVMSTLIELQLTVVDWLAGRGLPPATAQAYMAAFLQGLGAEFAVAPAGGLGGLAQEHETPGGLNEQVRQLLSNRGFFRDLRGELDALHRRLTGPERQPEH